MWILKILKSLLPKEICRVYIDPKTVPFEKGEIYRKNGFYPGTLANLREPFIMRDVRGQSVNVYPVQYNPVTKVLRVYSEITITVVNNTRSVGVNEFTNQKRRGTIDPQFNDMYSNLFINYSAIQGRGYPTGEDGELLVICYSDYMDYMKPYIDRKRSIGRKTTLIRSESTGKTAEEMKTYILNYYKNPANNLAYVLLVGSHAQIPMHEYDKTHYIYDTTVGSDNYYGQLAGDDKYMEILIGRMSAENASQVQTQVQRTIWYERDINTTNTWLNKAIGLASSEQPKGGHDGGEADYVHMNNIRNRLLTYGYNPVYQEYYGNCPDVSNTDVTQISQRFNDGVGVANYCNHGMPTYWGIKDYPNNTYLKYTNNHVDALTNTGKLPFIFSVACLVGRMKGLSGVYVNSTCFAETWLRATQNNQPTGAVATLMATISISWQPPMTAQDEFVDLCLDTTHTIVYPDGQTNYGSSNTFRTFAGAAINATQKMLMVYGTTTENTEVFDSWTVFGDPTLMIRTKIPQAMTVTHNPTILWGATTFSVSCNVDGALVAMSYADGSNEVQILGTATVSGGVANLTFSPIASTNSIKVTVTGRDRVTYQGTVSVCATTNFTNQTVSVTRTVTGGNINVQNVTVTNGATLTIKATCDINAQGVTVKDNSKLILDAGGEVNIISDFDIELGSQFEIR